MSYELRDRRRPHAARAREGGQGRALEGSPARALRASAAARSRRSAGFAARPSDVDDVVVGCVSQAGEQGANLARNAVLAAGWPIAVSGVTLNRFCGSGVQAVNFGAMGVASGAQDLVVAGGVESMSRVPMGSDGGGQDGGNVHLRERFFQVPQGISADLIATVEGISRGGGRRRGAARSQRQCGSGRSRRPASRARSYPR